MSPDTLYPNVMSRRYDADFQAIFGGQDRGDLDFFTGLGANTVGPICEVGAGTGRVLLEVAAAAPDAQLVGVEPSPAMRARFEQKLADVDPRVGARVALREGTFAALPLEDESQGLVFAAFRSFQHLLTVPDQLAALTEARRVLRPGGVLAIDLFDPDYRLLHDAEPTAVASYETAEGTLVERFDSRRIGRVAQRVDVGFRWIERGRYGRVVADDRASYAIRYTFPHELLHLLARVGFGDAELFGDYDRSPLAEAPRELIAVARRG